MNKWNAVILAGDRGSSDPVANAANVNGKALVKFNGVTQIERIVKVLHDSQCVNELYALGPSLDCLNDCEEVSSMYKHYGVNYLPPNKGPSSSALLGVKKSHHFPTLVITSDLPLLTTDAIENYCKEVIKQDVDFVVGAVNYESINALLPELKKTRYQFSDSEVCFANVFAVLTPLGMKAIEYWQDIEQSRKNPLAVIRKIDWWSVLQYKLGCISVSQASLKLSRKLGANLNIEMFAVPELAIDVDSAHDYRVLKKFLEDK